jgi:hypothetical protein
MESAALDVTHWVGRTETVHDALAPAQALAAAAMFDAPNVTGAVGDAIPAAVALVLFPAPRAAGHARSDGHPGTRRLHAAHHLPRRMFAGARVRLHRPLRLGVPAERRAVIHDVTRKTGTHRRAGVRHGALSVRAGRRAVRRGGAGHRVSRAGGAVPPPDVRPWGRRAATRDRARDCTPTRDCCSASRRSPSTRIAFTTIASTPCVTKAIPGWWCTVRSRRCKRLGQPMGATDPVGVVSPWMDCAPRALSARVTIRPTWSCARSSSSPRSPTRRRCRSTARP